MKKSKPDMLSMMAMMQEQLALLDKKMDLVIEKTVLKSAQANAPKSDGSQQNGPHKERTLYEAVCADCHKVCEVPFRPSENRPVYCKECFAKRKNGGFPKTVPVPPTIVAAMAPAKKKNQKSVKKAKKKKT